MTNSVRLSDASPIPLHLDLTPNVSGILKVLTDDGDKFLSCMIVLKDDLTIVLFDADSEKEYSISITEDAPSIYSMLKEELMGSGEESFKYARLDSEGVTIKSQNYTIVVKLIN